MKKILCVLLAVLTCATLSSCELLEMLNPTTSSEVASSDVSEVDVSSDVGSSDADSVPDSSEPGESSDTESSEPEESDVSSLPEGSSDVESDPVGNESSEPENSSEEQTSSEQKIAVSSVAITAASDTVKVGGKLKLSADVLPEDATVKAVKWSVSSGKDYASISSSGELTGKAAGAVVIRADATDGSGKYATFKVTVTSDEKITIHAEKDVLHIGDGVQLYYEFDDGVTEDAVTWAVVSGDAVTVSDHGGLTAVKLGTAKIKATAAGDSSVYGYYVFTVEAVKVSSLSLSAGSSTVTVGKTLTVNVTIQPENADNKDVTWSVSSGSSYAKVDQNGVVTGLKKGSATIKVTAKDGSGKSATLKISVEEAGAFAGSGTKTDPYLISTSDDLANLSSVLNKSGYYFKQTADISLENHSPWKPIGNDNKHFKHNYDGGGFNITGLTLSGDEYYGGLFGYVENGVFSNINIEGFYADVDASCIGGVAGTAYKSSFENCRVSGEIKAGSNLGLLVGQIIAEDKTVTVNNCSASGKITGDSYIGGLIGQFDSDYDNQKTKVTKCHADVDIFDGLEDVGGLIGKFNSGTVENCYATGDINIKGSLCHGGLIGEVYEKSEISRCYATGNLSCNATSGYGAGAFTGGLIGYMLSRVSVHDCYATGNVTCKGSWSDCQDHNTYNGGVWIRYRNPVGALIGCVYAVSSNDKITVYNCYATGTVKNDKVCVTDNVRCDGSLIGLIHDVATVKLIKSEYRVSSATLINDKHIDITEDMLTETMIGKLGNNYCVSSLEEYFTPGNYIVRNSTNALVGQYKSLPSYRVVTNITKSDLSNQATFEGFDFSKVWKMGSDGPVLR